MRVPLSPEIEETRRKTRASPENMEEDDGERRNRTKIRSEGREGEQRKMDFGEVEGRSEVDGLYAAGKGRKKKKTTKGGGGGRRD